jgi:aminoglycoside phosphotransferase (APT) family kinase protein
MTVHTPTEVDTVAAVLAAAASRFFGGPASIESLARESGGASRQTWSFDAVVKGTRHGLILRRDPPILNRPADSERSTSLDRATEFRVLAAAHKAGVRAPEPLFELLPADGLGEAYVMRRIGGTAIARKLLRDPP